MDDMREEAGGEGESEEGRVKGVQGWLEKHKG